MPRWQTFFNECYKKGVFTRKKEFWYIKYELERAFFMHLRGSDFFGTCKGEAVVIVVGVTNKIFPNLPPPASIKQLLPWLK